MSADLLRNLRTEVVHKPGCPFAGAHAATWNWASDKDMAEVMSASFRYPWLHLCSHCLPHKCRCRRCRGLAVVPRRRKGGASWMP